MTEFEMDRRMSELMRLMVRGAASESERHEYQHLVAARAKRMTRTHSACPARGAPP